MYLHVKCKYMTRAGSLPRGRTPAPARPSWYHRAGDMESDGRHERASRTRSALVEGLLGLLEAGTLRPTAAEIAGSAGVSRRALFQHYKELDELFLDVAELHFRRNVVGLEPALLTHGPLDERLEVFLTRRTRMLERISPVRRAALLVAPTSPAVALKVRNLRRAKRREVERAFAPEIEAGDPLLFEALAAAASWSTWQALREHQSLSVTRAQAALRLLLERTLGL